MQLLRATKLFNVLLLLNSLQVIRSAVVTPEEAILRQYDFVVVGSGPAGATVAGKLANWDISVLVIEAGDMPPDDTFIPLMASEQLNRPGIDWAYTSERNDKPVFLGLTDVYLPAARIVGGGHSINYQCYQRGSKISLDLIESRYGATGWNFAEAQRIYMQDENTADDPTLSAECHGKSGPLYVQKPVIKMSAAQTFIDGFQDAGYQYTDPSCGVAEGVYDTVNNQRGGRRWSAFDAFLAPHIKATCRDCVKPVLDIMPNAMVSKIIIKNKIAYGVTFIDLKTNKTYSINACREVIVSAGAIRTPQLLMLSGIGPQATLESFGIEVIADLPVGQNFQDDISMTGIWVQNLPADSVVDMANAADIYQYLRDETGPFTTSAAGVLGVAYAKTPYAVDDPEIELLIQAIHNSPGNLFHPTTSALTGFYGPAFANNGGCFVVYLTRPESRGEITIVSTNIMDYPVIKGNYFSDADNLDFKRVVEGAKLAVKIIKGPVFSAANIKLYEGKHPNCTNYELWSDDYYSCLVNFTTGTGVHYCSSCSMGGPNSPHPRVVDPTLKVLGIQRLRIVDNSVLPLKLLGHASLPAMFVGGKGSEIIRSEMKSIPSLCRPGPPRPPQPQPRPPLPPPRPHH